MKERYLTTVLLSYIQKLLQRKKYKRLKLWWITLALQTANSAAPLPSLTFSLNCSITVFSSTFDFGSTNISLCFVILFQMGVNPDFCVYKKSTYAKFNKKVSSVLDFFCHIHHRNSSGVQRLQLLASTERGIFEATNMEHFPGSITTKSSNWRITQVLIKRLHKTTYTQGGQRRGT